MWGRALRVSRGIARPYATPRPHGMVGRLADQELRSLVPHGRRTPRRSQSPRAGASRRATDVARRLRDTRDRTEYERRTSATGRCPPDAVQIPRWAVCAPACRTGSTLLPVMAHRRWYEVSTSDLNASCPTRGTVRRGRPRVGPGTRRLSGPSSLRVDWSRSCRSLTSMGLSGVRS